ncbi:MAG: NAD-dependent succinate-semialdehyde dehydrogenase, partial [Actinomycetota bacterium]
MGVTVQDEQRVVGAVRRELLIGGEWRSAQAGGTMAVRDPATGEVLCEIADAGPEDGKAALAAAADAQSAWAATPPRERAEILRRGYETLMSRQDDLALLMTLEMGKPLPDSRGEIAYAAEFFRWFSEEASRIEGSYRMPPAGGSRILTMRQPVGPCLFITPWNFPMAMGTRKIGPAVAAGCTMVIKPAGETPLSMLALASILEEVGLPSGVLNVVTTSRSGRLMEPLIRDPRARKLSFTGSTDVGRRLVEQSAEQLLKVSMELGGNAPFLVFEDADLDKAVEGAMAAKMRNIGEACTAANRFLVHESVAADFSSRLAERMGKLVVGKGTQDGVQVGPLITEGAREGVASLVADATDSGARVLTGGDAVDGPGWFYAPTVLADVPTDARVMHEEIFGPVAPVTTFSTEEQALGLANGTPYGLIAYAYTENLYRALRVSEGLETGMVGLNAGVISNPAAPFGGVKASGFGREGGREGIEEFLEIKYVGIGGM